MTTIEAVEQSLQRAGVAYSLRGSGRLNACGCVVKVDSFGNAQIDAEAPDADKDRIVRALKFY